MKYEDYYSALGVARDADEEAIKKAYRRLARLYHPDVSKEPGAEARFKKIGEAYATLKDPARRAAYDQLGRRREGEEFAPPPHWPGTTAASPFAGADLADLLEALAARHGASRQGGATAHGRDYEASVSISLEQAHRGTVVNLDLASEEGPRNLQVTVPPGVTEGQTLRLRGKGAPGRGGGAPGDIYLHIRLAAHPLFRVDGQDLYFDLALAPWEAVLGAEIELPTLDGHVLLRVPAGTQAGRKLRLRGRGLANGRGGRGNLYAVTHVDVPAHPTGEERKLFEQLAQVSAFRPRPAAHGETHHHEHATA